MAYRLLPGGYIDETGPHRGVPPTQEDFDRVASLTAHRRFFAEGKIEFQPLDSLSQSGMEIYMRENHIGRPYDAEIVQEMPIEEAKRRWPNTPVKGEGK